ncbi:MAG: hypothetical protein BAJALOKI3v1_330038 [Promethearchaeota archaeon]|nr:MAG: hypothetical protein BAJALOKI3v1_330038 [Candidatus Lokiarchaeota archaeon]
MADKFYLKIESGEVSQNPRKQMHTINNPKNSSFPELKVQLPVAYEGPKGENGEFTYTPEHYFIAAISGCFFTTFSVVCSNSSFNYKSLTIEATGTVGTSSGEKMMEKIDQIITLTIPSSEREIKAKRILEITEERCPLAKSVKTKIINHYNIVFEKEG